jgi:hypothetical protein
MRTALSRSDPCAEKDEFRLGSFAAATVCALIAAGLCVQALPGAGLERKPRIRAVKPRADAYVSEAARRENFGRSRVLKVASAPAFRTYVTFDADLRSDEVQRVSLLLYSRTRSQSGYQVRLVGGRWQERQITFANAPGLSPNFVVSGPLRKKSWKAVDVTSLVSGDEQRISFALTSGSAKGIEFASRETGLHGPRLVVELRPEPTDSTSTQIGPGPQARDPRKVRRTFRD